MLDKYNVLKKEFFVRNCLLNICLYLCVSATLTAQTKKNSDYLKYIELYRNLAVEQMREHKIPASITLAQAILESSAGKSDLARLSNNHFGIKCGSNWNGRKMKHGDDRPNECFRVYDNVRDSYEDHSKFLLRDRYKPLFKLNKLDYKAWARGLKACGYATNPTYAERLIKLIDLYDLHQYDEDEYGVSVARDPVDYEEITLKTHQIRSNNGVMCVIAGVGDTWQTLSKELSISIRKLVKYNEADESVSLNAGDYVYLEKKRKKASKEHDVWHKIEKGESMYSISQLYGIRMKYLYKMNFKDENYVIISGDLLKIR